jgi:hypothetical protein
VNEKKGFTLIVTMDLRAGRVLPPTAIHHGTFGVSIGRGRQRLMHEAMTNQREDIQVLFKETHWNNGQICVLYLQHIVALYASRPHEVIGLIWDAATCHESEEINNFVAENNANPNTPDIHLFGIDGGLTSIIQPCDLVVNKDLKQGVKQGYMQLKIERTTTNDPGHAEFKRDREDMNNIIVNTIQELNRKQRATASFRKSFRFCGLDPDIEDEDQTEFYKHLNNIAQSSTYRARKDLPVKLSAKQKRDFAKLTGNAEREEMMKRLTEEKKARDGAERLECDMLASNAALLVDGSFTGELRSLVDA